VWSLPGPLLFAVDAGAAPDLTGFMQYGAIGIFLILLVMFARSAIQRERDQADKAVAQERARADRIEAENVRLNALLLDRVIPALTSATRAAEESADLLQALHRERELIQLLQQQRRIEGGP